MRTPILFLALCGCWLLSLILVLTAPQEKPTVPYPSRVVSQLPAAFAILAMGSILWIYRGTGTSQLLESWRMWTGLWPFLMLVTGISALLHVGWAIVAQARSRPSEVWVALTGAGTAAFAFVVVGTNYPSV